MKSILMVVVCAFCSLGAMAQDSTQQHSDNPAADVNMPHYKPSWAGDPDKYCATLMAGKIAIIYKGKTLIDDKNFNNGFRLMKDGTIVRPDGTRRQLKNKECVDANGNMQ